MKETKADWLRSEIEKLEGMKDKADHSSLCPTKQNSNNPCGCNYYHNHALTSIITRYKEELKVLESK